MAPVGGGNIKVVVRVRPFNGRGALLIILPGGFTRAFEINTPLKSSQNLIAEQNVSCK